MEYSRNLLSTCEDYRTRRLNTYTNRQKEMYEKFLKKSESDISKLDLYYVRPEDLAVYADEIYIEMHQRILTKIIDLDLYIKNMLQSVEYNYAFIIKIAYSLSRFQQSNDNYNLYLKRFRHIREKFIKSF